MKKSSRVVVSYLSLIVGASAWMATARADCDYPTCVPGNGQVCLFPDADCNGTPVLVGALTIWPNLGAGTFPNDTLSSWLLGDHTELVICKDANFGVGCQAARRDDTYGIANSQESMPVTYCGASGQPLCNDMASSLRVSSYEVQVVSGTYGANKYCMQPSATTCAFFTDSTRQTGMCVALPMGNRPNSGSFGLPDNTISSILCGTSVKAYIYDGTNYGGSSYSSPYTDIGNMGTANDKTSSLKVVTR